MTGALFDSYGRPLKVSMGRDCAGALFDKYGRPLIVPVLEPNLENDHTYSGNSFEGTAGEALAQFDLVYRKSDSKYWKADADAASTMPAVAMASASIAANATGVFIAPGSFVRDDSWAWTVGATLYTSGTAGGMTETAPTIPEIVGHAETADVIFFNPLSGSDALFIPLAQKAAASGVASLNASSKVVQDPATVYVPSGGPLVANLDMASYLFTNAFSMFRALRRELIPFPIRGWAAGTTVSSGSGTVSKTADYLYFVTGATHASTAGVSFPLYTPGGAWGRINWDKKFMLQFILMPVYADWTNTVVRLLITQSTAIEALAAHGLGLTTNGANINLATYGTGGAQVLTSAAVNVENVVPIWIGIEHDPGVADALYIGGTLKCTLATAASIPSTTPAASYNIFGSVARTGGADVALEGAYIYWTELAVQL